MGAAFPVSRSNAERIWVVSGCLLFAGLVWRNMAILGDGFWCLAAGDFVLKTGSLPSVNPFAFTSRAVPWVLHMPAFQVGGAWLVAHAGLRSLMVASTVPIASAAAILWLVPSRDSRARALVFPVVLLYLLVDADDISARGQAFGDLGLALLLVAIDRLRAGSRVWPGWPVLLGAVWANCHPSFLLAVVLPLSFAAAEMLEPAALRRGPLRLAAFSGLALVGTCLNPYSIVLLIDVVKLWADPTTAGIDLFQSPDFQSPGWLAPFALALGLLYLLSRRAGTGRGRSDAALLIVFMIAACMARRYVTALVAFEAVQVARMASALPASTTPRWTSSAMLGVAGLQGVIGAVLLAEHKDPLRDVPAEASEAIERLALPDRVLNPYHWGGFLDWAWQGRRKVFIDGRNQLFSNGVFDDAALISAVAPQAGTLLDVYEIQTVLWESGAPLDGALARDERWREVHRDRLAVVYVRR